MDSVHHQANLGASVQGGSPQSLPDVDDKNHGDEERPCIDEDSTTSSENMSGESYEEIKIKKGQWSDQEDRKLKALFAKHGSKWRAIASDFGTRTGKQCRERWLYHHQSGIKANNTWTDEEIQILIDAHSELDNRWAKIAERLPGRNDNAIKNYFNKTERMIRPKKNKSKSKITALHKYIASIRKCNRRNKPPARKENCGEMIEQNNENERSKNGHSNANQSNSGEDLLLWSPPSNPGTNDSVNNDMDFMQVTEPDANELTCVVEGSSSGGSIISQNTYASHNMNANFSQQGVSSENTNGYVPEQGFTENLNACVAEQELNPENINDEYFTEEPLNIDEYFSEDAFISLAGTEYLTEVEPTPSVIGSSNNDNSEVQNGANLPSPVAGINSGDCYSPLNLNDWVPYSPPYANEWDFYTGTTGESSGQSSGLSKGESTTVQDADAVPQAVDAKGKGKMPGYV